MFGRRGLGDPATEGSGGARCGMLCLTAKPEHQSPWMPGNLDAGAFQWRTAARVDSVAVRNNNASVSDGQGKKIMRCCRHCGRQLPRQY